jgi:hypothetical protein
MIILSRCVSLPKLYDAIRHRQAITIQEPESQANPLALGRGTGETAESRIRSQTEVKEWPDRL